MCAYGKLSKDVCSLIQILPIVWPKMGDKVTIFFNKNKPKSSCIKPSVSDTENLSSNPAH